MFLSCVVLLVAYHEPKRWQLKVPTRILKGAFTVKKIFTSVFASTMVSFAALSPWISQPVRAAENPTNLASEVMVSAKQINTKQYNIQYAHVSGLSNSAVQAKINQVLSVNPKTLQLMFSSDSYTSNYAELYQAGNLLELSYYWNDMPQQSADGGLSGDTIYLINLKTGQFYTMKDLFKSDSSYLKNLTSILRKEDREHMLFSNFSGVKATDGFALIQTGFQVVFQQDEWTPHVLDAPSFGITFNQVNSQLNKSGSLWKEMQAPKAKSDLAIQQKDIAKVKSLGYQPYQPNYSGFAAQAQELQGFAAVNLGHNQTLYAIDGYTGDPMKGQMMSHIFFFVNNRYLGTDTLKKYSDYTIFYPNGKDIVVQYEPANSAQQSFTIRYEWNGKHLQAIGQFPKSF